MQIIKDAAIIDDHWLHVADDEELPKGDVTVSKTRWQKDKPRLREHQGQIGLRLEAADPIEEIADDLHELQLIELNFTTFTDGRAFSQAWLLRNRFHYCGEIRAVGNFMLDQVFYLHRTGVNAFQLQQADQFKAALSALNDFSVHYQASVN